MRLNSLRLIPYLIIGLGHLIPIIVLYCVSTNIERVSDLYASLALLSALIRPAVWSRDVVELRKPADVQHVNLYLYWSDIVVLISIYLALELIFGTGWLSIIFCISFISSFYVASLNRKNHLIGTQFFQGFWFSMVSNLMVFAEFYEFTNISMFLIAAALLILTIWLNRFISVKISFNRSGFLVKGSSSESFYSFFRQLSLSISIVLVPFIDTGYMLQAKAIQLCYMPVLSLYRPILNSCRMRMIRLGRERSNLKEVYKIWIKELSNNSISYIFLMLFISAAILAPIFSENPLFIEISKNYWVVFLVMLFSSIFPPFAIYYVGAEKSIVNLFHVVCSYFSVAILLIDPFLVIYLNLVIFIVFNIVNLISFNWINKHL
jgi:hypothetical protein